MKTLALVAALAALAFTACGPMILGPSDTVRCAHLDGGYSTVVCSCAVSCALQPDMLVHVEEAEGCGEAACWQDPAPARRVPSEPAAEAPAPDAGPTLLQ